MDVAARFIVIALGLSCDAQGPPLTAVRTELPIEALAYGDVHAPVTVVEFGAFSCGACAAFTLEVFPRLDTAYFRSGRARYRYVDLAGSGPYQEIAATAQCAAERVGLPAAKKAVFEIGRVTATPAQLADSLAQRLGVAKNVFDACTRAAVSDPARRAERKSARKLQVGATPTFVVGFVTPGQGLVGWPLIGMNRPDSLARLIEAAELVARRSRLEKPTRQ